jgi:ethanolamine transporter EutH
MKPIKSFIPFAKWLLRLAIVLIVYMNYFDTAITFSFRGLEYFISLSIVIVAVLILVGGLLKGSTLTMISGFLLFAAVIVQLVILSGFSVNGLIGIYPLAALGFYFFASGNA